MPSQRMFSKSIEEFEMKARRHQEWQASLREIDMKLDILDNLTGLWWKARIVDVRQPPQGAESHLICVRYDGFGPEFDEWLNNVKYLFFLFCV